MFLYIYMHPVIVLFIMFFPSCSFHDCSSHHVIVIIYRSDCEKTVSRHINQPLSIPNENHEFSFVMLSKILTIYPHIQSPLEV